MNPTTNDIITLLSTIANSSLPQTRKEALVTKLQNGTFSAADLDEVITVSETDVASMETALAIL